MTTVIVFGFIVGFIQSLIYTLLYLRQSKEWVKIIGTTGIIYVMFQEALFIKQNLSDLFKVENSFIYFLIIFFLTTISFFLIFILFFYKNHNKNSPANRISFGQFMLNPYNALNIDFDANIKDKEKILSNIKKIEEEIEDKIKNHKDFSTLKLPINHTLLVDNEFLTKYITCFDTISQYICIIRQDKKEFLKNKKNYNKTFEENFKKYIYSLSRLTSIYLIDYNKHNIRVHFREFNHESNTFEKFYMYNKKESTDMLTSMSAHKGIISSAMKNKVSLVKSANLDLHIKGRNDDYWQDYITMVFTKIVDKDDNPLYSMTISIHEAQLYSKLLYFLSYIKIEQYIEECLFEVYSKLQSK